MSVRAGISAVLIAIAAPALAGAASPLESPACAQSFDKYQQAISWYESGNRVLLTAESGCSDRYGFPVKLKNLVMVIDYGQQRKLKVEASEGIYSPADRTIRVQTLGMGMLTAELNTGQIRSMRGFYVNLKHRDPKAYFPKVLR